MKQVMCQYFQCDKPATVRIKEAGMNCCDNHLITNTAKFRAIFTTEEVKQPKGATK